MHDATRAHHPRPSYFGERACGFVTPRFFVLAREPAEACGAASGDSASDGTLAAPRGRSTRDGRASGTKAARDGRSPSSRAVCVARTDDCGPGAWSSLSVSVRGGSSFDADASSIGAPTAVPNAAREGACTGSRGRLSSSVLGASTFARSAGFVVLVEDGAGGGTLRDVVVRPSFKSCSCEGRAPKVATSARSYRRNRARKEDRSRSVALPRREPDRE